ncbi:hypothetical protein, partial [Enterococcus faecium]|uniref:hypothetical protein n=1 Tax=Enterococcus faecium TaxID=1352 RepID=UPI003F51D2A3
AFRGSYDRSGPRPRHQRIPSHPVVGAARQRSTRRIYRRPVCSKGARRGRTHHHDQRQNQSVDASGRHATAGDDRRRRRYDSTALGR